MKKNKKNFFNSKRALVIMTLVCISAIFLVSAKIVPVAPVKQAAATVLVPFQTGLNQVGKWFSDQAAGFQQVRTLAEENAELTTEIEQLREENSQLVQDQEELTRLRELYDIDEKYSEYDKVEAEVISRDATNWYSTFMINKGTNDGLAVDMNVITGGGLVGIITEVGSNWATVRSIIDDSSNVSGMTVTTGDTCIINGDLLLIEEGKLAFSQMNTDEEIEPGEQIITSNISDKYLKGILIGYVDEVEEDSNHLTKTGYITPAVDFQHIQEVLVIKQLKQTGGED